MEEIKKLDKEYEEIDKSMKNYQKPSRNELYAKEQEDIIILRKKQFFTNLTKISHNLNKKKDIKEFIEDKKDYLQDFLLSDINKSSRCYIFFIVKIIGLIFISSNLVGIYQLIGLNETIKDEVIFTVKRFINLTMNDTHDINNTYYYQEQNFSELYEKKTLDQLPDLSLFFLSSLFSNFLLKSLGYPFMSIFILIVNSLILNFGLNNFHFLNKENLSSNYTLNEFLILIFYFIFFNLSLGLVALVPHKLFSDGYFFYEKWLELNKNSANKNNIQLINPEDNENVNKNNIINIEDENQIIKEKKEKDKLNISNPISFNIIDIKDNEIYEPNNKQEVFTSGKYNGYYFSYLFSFLFSMICKIILSKFFLFEENDNKSFFFKLFLLYLVPILVSFIFYSYFISIFKKKTKKKSPKEISIMKFCGYLIYIEKKPQEKKICCEGCRVGMRKFSYAFFGCKCCECEVCCKCLPLSQCCKTKEDLSEFNNRNENICIFYKINGICSWFCGFLFNNYGIIFYFILNLYLFELLNIGFKPSLSEYIKNYEGENRNNFIVYIHIIYLSGILFFYFLTVVLGYLMTKCFTIKKIKKGEGMLLGYGIICYLIAGSIISFIISILVYYEIIQGDLSFYLITISLSSNEYFRLFIISSFSKLIDDHIELLSHSSIISMFLLLYRILVLIIDFFNVNKKHLILFQFILGLIIAFIGTCIFMFIIICLKSMGFKSDEDVEKYIKETRENDIKYFQDRKDQVNEAKRKLLDKVELNQLNDEDNKLLNDKDDNN